MSNDRNGLDPTVYQGVVLSQNPPNIIAQRAPTANDRRYKIGTLWVDKSSNASYQLTSVVAAVANWQVLGSDTGAVSTLSGDTGTASPVAGNINIVGGTNVTTVGSGDDVTVNLDAAISLATSVTSPLYLAPAATDLAIRATAAKNIIMRMGDAAGAEKISFTDSGDAEVANLDSDGQLNLLAGDCIVVRSDAGAEVLVDVTNSDNTSTDSDAFFEAAVGGTSSGNPGMRFQISGGQNYAMGIDNASAADDLLIGANNDIGTSPLLRLFAAGNVQVEVGNLAIAASGKMLQVKGGAATDFVGSTTLSAGVKDVLNTNIASGDIITLQRIDAGGSTAIGSLTYSITNGVKFTITSIQAGTPGATETNDISNVAYTIVRPI